MAKQTFTTGQVLTAAQMTSLQQTAMGGGSATAKTASYVLVAADAGTTVAMNAAGATTITVNTGLFAAGDTVFIQNLGAGACTVTAGTATVATAGSLILPQNDAGILYFTATGASIFYDYIQAGAVSPLTTKGDLYGFSTLDARIPIGANATVLTADSNESLGLKWATASSGGMTSIASGSLTGSSVDITSIPGTYNQLVLELKDFYTSGNGYAVYVRITGETTGYQGSYLKNVGGTNATAVISTDNFTKFLTESLKNTDNNNYMVVNFPNYASSVRKLAQGYGSWVDNGSATGVGFVNAAINYTSAISSLTVTIEPSGQTFSGGTYVLWGIK